MKVTILTIGDEILIGQIVNTNAAWLGSTLEAAGISVRRMATIGDAAADIGEALTTALSDSQMVLITGGLGPTHDDITRSTVARALGLKLREDQHVLDSIRQRFEERGREMPRQNYALALVPEGFSVLSNPVGTAPGLWGEVPVRNTSCIVVMLPGVPYEMKALMNTEVLPRLSQMTRGSVVRHLTLRTSGTGEVVLADLIGPWPEGGLDGVRLAFLPNARTGVKIRLTVRGNKVEEADRRMAVASALVRERVADFLYGEGAEEIEEVVGRLLEKASMTIATAESCTGGSLADRLTDVPGSSAWVRGAVVAYDNAVKVGVLGVTEEALGVYGAVSEQVAIQMAIGARRVCGSDMAISTTGIAGPGGGTEQKPVGTVWVGYADSDGASARMLRLTRNRRLNKDLTCSYALFDLFRRLRAQAD